VCLCMCVAAARCGSHVLSQSYVAIRSLQRVEHTSTSTHVQTHMLPLHTLSHGRTHAHTHTHCTHYTYIHTSTSTRHICPRTLSLLLLCAHKHTYISYMCNPHEPHGDTYEQPPRAARRHIRATPTSRTETHTSKHHAPHLQSAAPAATLPPLRCTAWLIRAPPSLALAPWLAVLPRGVGLSAWRVSEARKHAAINAPRTLTPPHTHASTRKTYNTHARTHTKNV